MNCQKELQSMIKTDSVAIQTVIEDGLCVGCGACAGVCPQGALKIDYPRSYKPVFEKSKCIQCNTCYQVCPGKGWPAVKWANELCDSAESTMHPKYGPIKSFFLGKSTNPDIHLKGASGGVATSLSLYLLNTKQVDAVVVVVLENGRPVVKITDRPKEVISSAGSKYSPVPLMEHVINELKNNSRKIAMTVIPCQMAAFRYAIEKYRLLAKNVILTIGLFCGDIKDYKSVTSIADTLGLCYPENAKFLGWRCGPWPGNARFELADGSFKDKPLHPWLDISIPYYALHRCLMCPSRENWLADLALADNHVGKTNETIIIARTERGSQTLRSAEKDGFLKLTEIEANQVDKFVTCTKFIPALSYIHWREKNNLPVPKYDYDVKKYFAKDIALFRSMKYRLFIIVRNEKILNFLITHPRLLEKIGYFLNNFPTFVPGKRLIVRLAKLLYSLIVKLKNLVS